MHVSALARYPVKSLLGEPLDGVGIEARGLVGDRLWAVRDPDGKLGSGKSSRRFRKMDGLLQLSARYAGDVPLVRFPDGRELAPDPALDDALSAYVGRRVSLGRETDVPHHDDGAVHVVTTASLRALQAGLGAPLDWRRFRPNIVLDTPGETFVEEGWVGRELAIGPDVVLRIVMPMPRCVMVNAAHGAIPEDRAVLRTVTEHNDGALGVLAEVVAPGMLSRGDVGALG
ncbi:MAG: MOSC domain-containing protein [Actinomycetota bacterium]|nr:MOSC domain-containing protein [Actinomycetota bacterium]